MQLKHHLLVIFALAATSCVGAGDDNGSAPSAATPERRPDGVAVWQHSVLPLEQRGADRIELVRDLIIGDEPEEVEGGFYRPQDIAIDRRGALYVADAGDQDVRVIGADGRQRRVLGGPGQGPGEFRFPRPITVAGSRVVVNDRRNGRLSVWDIDGNHIADHNHANRFDPALLAGLPDGTLLALHTEADGYLVPPGTEPGNSGLFRNVVARYSVTGEELSRWAEFPRFGLALMTPGGDVDAASAAAYNEGALDGSSRTPVFAVDTAGRAYIIETDEYRIRATTGDGATRWRLSAPFERHPYPVALVDRRAASSSHSRSERYGRTIRIERSNYTWDEYLPALSSVQVDGHGHLWVFPTQPLPFPADSDAPVELPPAVPLDVYSLAGELLYSGEVMNIPWSAAFGDWVYAIERDPETDNQVVVRYRLVEPF